jgi:hypothetical protein
MPAGLYGNNGPVKKLGNARPMTTRIERRAPQPTDRISAAIAKVVPGLTAKQRAAVVKAVKPLLAPADEGRPL